jgi:hypothetical protein
MQITIYFNSQQKAPSVPTQNVQEAINAATSLRDEFLVANSEEIAKIVSEQIHFIHWQNDSYIIAVIQLTYYQK